MKKTLQILLSFLLAVGQGAMVKAQNLIPNGDFELGASVSTAMWTFPIDTDCSYNPYDTLLGLDFWTTTSFPGRFYYGLPFFNCYDNIISHSGTAHVEFNWDDGGKTILINPLQTGKKYRLKYYLCLDSMWYAYYQQQPYVIFTLNNGGNVINSPLVTFNGFGVWTLYDTTFTAVANSTEFEFHGDYIHGTVIYMDDISLQIDTFSQIDGLPISNPYYTIFQDNNVLNIGFNIPMTCTISIHDVLGRCIYYSSLHKGNNAEIIISDMSTKIVFLTIISDKTIITKKILLTKN